MGLNQWRLHWLTLAKDLIRLAQLAVLAFQSLHTLGHLAGDARALAAIDLGLLDPIVQGLGRTADLHRYRHGSLSTRSMLALIVEDQTHGAFAHFGGKFVRCLAHDALSYSGVGASGKPGAVHGSVFSPLAASCRCCAENPLIPAVQSPGTTSNWGLLPSRNFKPFACGEPLRAKGLPHSRDDLGDVVIG